MATTPARRRLRQLLDNGELIVAPGVFDGLSAHLARRTGHVAAPDRRRRGGIGVRAARHRPGHRDRDGGSGGDDRGRIGGCPADRRRRHRLRRPHERGAHGSRLRRGRGGRHPTGGPGVSQTLRSPARQAGRRRRGVRTDAGRRAGRPIRRRPAGGGPHRRARPARAGRGDRARQPVRARGGRHRLRGGAARRRRNRAHRNRSRRTPADQPGARRPDAAAVGGAAARAGLRHRHPPRRPADAHDVRDAAQPVRPQRHRPGRPSAGVSGRFLRLGGHGALAGPRREVRTHRGRTWA